VRERGGLRHLAGLAAAAVVLWLGLGMHRGLLLSEDIKSKVWPWAPLFARNEIAAPALSDPVWQFVPWLQMARRELLAGRLPLWNPHQSGGVPLLGNAVSALGSPLVWPILAFGVAAAWNLSLLLRLLVALGGAFLWLRDLGRSTSAAFMGATAFALSGPFIAWLEHPQTLTAAATPFVLLFAQGLVRGPSREDFVGLCLATYLVVSGGHPETLMMAALLSAAWVAAQSGGRARAALRPIGAALLGAGLAAPFLLTFVEYFWNSAARSGAGRRPFVLAAGDLARFVSVDRAGSNVIEAAATVSVTLLLLAVAGVVRARRGTGAIFWGAVAGIILLVAYDNPLSRVLATRTPAYWTRALLFLPLAAAFLGSGALDALRARLAAAGNPALARVAGVLAVGLVAGELLIAARGVHGRSQASDLALTTPLLESLATDREPFRILPLHTFLPPDSATASGLDDVRGYDALSPRGWGRQVEAMGRVERAATQNEVLEPWGLRPGGAALDFWNVKYVLLHPQFGFGASELNARLGLDLEETYSGADGRILRNRRALPRVRLAGPGRVTIEERASGLWRLRVETAQPDVLTVADPAFPGWVARLDGRAVDLAAEPGEAMSLPVPAGAHRVELSYRPGSFRLGCAVAAVAAAILALAWRRLPRRPSVSLGA
jgi:hypothetical protein